MLLAGAKRDRPQKHFGSLERPKSAPDEGSRAAPPRKRLFCPSPEAPEMTLTVLSSMLNRVLQDTGPRATGVVRTDCPPFSGSASSLTKWDRHSNVRGPATDIRS
jgi:hypothetical protein